MSTRGSSVASASIPNTGMSRLETVRISRRRPTSAAAAPAARRPASAIDCGRVAARGAARPRSPAEILEADLAPLALELACWGAADPATLAWLDPPPAATLAQARDLLQRLEAIDARGQATAIGRSMAALGTHPRLAHMIERAGPLGLGQLACEIAALLTERDPLRAGPGAA